MVEELFLATFESVDAKKDFQSLLHLSYFDNQIPETIRVDGKERADIKFDPENLLNTSRKLNLVWESDNFSCAATYEAEGKFGFHIFDFAFDELTALQFIQRLPMWEVVTFGDIYSQWRRELKYAPPSFGSDHTLLGWGCAFKGTGHNRVVSRRFLEHGPWRTIRDEEHDITLIQFHDLEADAATALDQARGGHEFIAAPLQGGFYQRNLRVQNPEMSGVYDSDEKKLFVVIPGNEPVTRAQMMDACKIRHFQLLGESKPLENVAFVFVGGEAEAQPYLPEMWMRGLEVYAIDKGIEHRLDLDYVLNLEKPDWVQRLENV
jgi:hypothetical protein